jgi:hypothetical protein
VLYGRLLDNNSHRRESLADLSYPVVSLEGRKSRGDRFVESPRGDLYGVLNVSKIPDRNCARSKNHARDRNIFVFCSLHSNKEACALAVSNHLYQGTMPVPSEVGAAGTIVGEQRKEDRFGCPFGNTISDQHKP